MREKVHIHTQLFLQPSTYPYATYFLPNLGLKFSLTPLHLDKNVNGEESPISRWWTCISHLVQTWNIRSNGGMGWGVRGRGDRFALRKLSLVSERWLYRFSLATGSSLDQEVSPSPLLQCELDISTILNSQRSPHFSDPQCLPCGGGIMLLLSQGCYENHELRLTQCFSRVAS